MIENSAQVEQLLQLPIQERLRLARILIDSTIEEEMPSNGLLSLAGLYEGGNGNTAERTKEILREEVDAVEGLSKR
jgi:hypothetical protein